MATSRTGTAHWKNLRARALRLAQANGTTHCPTCGTQLDYTTSRQPNSPEPDHITPHANGGQDHIDNLRITCRHCNQTRGNRSITTTPRPDNRPTYASGDW